MQGTSVVYDLGVCMYVCMYSTMPCHAIPTTVLKRDSENGDRLTKATYMLQGEGRGGASAAAGEGERGRERERDILRHSDLEPRFGATATFHGSGCQKQRPLGSHHPIHPSPPLRHDHGPSSPVQSRLTHSPPRDAEFVGGVGAAHWASERAHFFFFFSLL